MPNILPTISPIVYARRRDPTQTTSLRNAFAREMSKRFTRLRRLIIRAIVEEDVFGLREPTTLQAQTPGPRRFAFRTSAEKITAFMTWLERAVQQEILEVSDINQVGTGVNAAWTNRFVRAAYEKGVQRGRGQVVELGTGVPTLVETGGISAAMSAPVHLDRVGLLYTRMFTDLKGITDAMDSQISRVLAEGLSTGKWPIEIARNINSVIKDGGDTLAIRDTLGRFIPAERRAKILARTEIIRSHAEGQLQEFENWRVSGVTSQAEWITAQDDRVCPQCLPMEGRVFPINEARGMIPLHPQCRCMWLPVI